MNKGKATERNSHKGYINIYAFSFTNYFDPVTFVLIFLKGYGKINI